MTRRGEFEELAQRLTLHAARKGYNLRPGLAPMRAMVASGQLTEAEAIEAIELACKTAIEEMTPEEGDAAMARLADEQIRKQMS